MKLKLVVALAIVALATGACVGPNGQVSKQGVGTVVGGAAGAVAGAQFGKGKGQLAMTALGAALGAYAGSEVGKGLDELDRMKAEEAHRKAMNAPVGQTIAWNNPDNGHRGTVTSTRDGRSSSGQYCREYQQDVVIGGKTERAYGTACRQPDGSWQVVNN